MQKLKSKVLDKLIASHVTSTELNLLLYISHYQFDRGNVMGIYYRDVCAAIDVSYQAFYDALKGLQEKNIIMAQKGSYYDWDVLILDNDFSNVEANSESYISTGHDLFHSHDFYALKANEKLLAMHMIKVSGANKGRYCISVKNLYSIFTKMLCVTKRAIQNYLKNLKKFFLIGIRDNKYWITPRKKVYKANAPTDKKLFSQGIAKTVLRRNRVKNAPETFTDTVSLVAQYYKDYGSRLQECFSKAFEKSLYCRNERQSNKYKWNRNISPAFVHKLLRKELGIEC